MMSEFDDGRTVVGGILSGSLSRRTLLRRAVVLGVAAPAIAGLIAACDDDDDDGEDVAAEADDEDEPEPDDVEDEEEDEEEADEPEEDPDEEEDVDDEPADGEPRYGGSLSVLEPNDFVNMWPAFTTGPTIDHCYDSLLLYEHDGNEWSFSPWLAESWDVTDETVTFHLREDVEFHDGTPFNAESAAWNIAQWRQHMMSRALPSVELLNEDTPVEAIDEYTIQLNLDAPDGPLLIQLSDIVRETVFGSPTAWEEMGLAAEDAESVIAREAVGTGPFVFQEWVSGSHVDVIRNDNYWAEDEHGNQLPYVDDATYRWVQEDSVRLVEMRAGEGDIAMFVRGRDVPSVENDPDLNYVQEEFAGGTTHRYFFNGQQGPFVDNPDLRKAVAYSINRQAMADVIGGGIGIPATLDVAPGNIGFDDSVPYYWFDLEKAWEHREASGVPSGFSFRFVVHDREVDRQQAEMVQQFVREIDLDVEIEVVERTAWVHQVREDNNFEFASQRTGLPADNAANWTLTWAPTGPAAYSRADEPEIWDKILESRAIMDLEERHNAYVELQTMMYEACWWGNFWILPLNWMLNRRVHNFPLVWNEVQHTAPRVWLDES
jgi:peptide/nickel transport system substrate-binding protein